VIEFLEAEHGRLLDQDVLAGLKRLSGDVEMTIVRGGDANGVERSFKHLGDRVRAGEAGERRQAAGGVLAILLGPRPRPAGDRGEFDLDQAEVAAEEPVGVQVLERRSVGVVEDHPQADHAGPELSRRGIRVHERYLTGRARPVKPAGKTIPQLNIRAVIGRWPNPARADPFAGQRPITAVMFSCP
jgi:hypothetical protein